MGCDASRWMRWRLLAVLALAWALPAAAAVPNKDAVPAYAEEQTILQHEQGTPEPGVGSVQSGRHEFDRHYLVPFGRDSEQDLILQRGGNTWRTWRNGPLATTAGTLLVIAIVVVLALWGFVGAVAGGYPETGRRILRFALWQRFIHWTTAISFILLGLTGLTVLFGKNVILPWLGHDAYSWIAIVAKYIHNFFGPLFILCSVLLFLTFVRRNFFGRVDWIWVRTLGGLRAREPVPAGFFNAGEKAWFWGGVVLLGLLMSATGLVLDFVNFKPTRYLIQIADFLHVAGATLYVIASFGHIYLGTVGTPGTYEGMRHGTVDEGWARTHHRLWYERLGEADRVTDTRIDHVGHVPPEPAPGQAP